MPKVKKVSRKASPAVAKAAPAPSKAVAVVASKAVVKGIPLKVAFKDLDADGLKTLRRKMRAAIRAYEKDGSDADGKVLRAHKIGGGRWVISPAMRKAAQNVLQ